MIILALDSLDHLEPVLKAEPDAIVLGIKSLSSRCHALADPDRLASWVDFFHERNIQVYLNAQALIEQSLLELIRHDFFKALEAGVDAIYVADDGYIALADQVDTPLDSLKDEPSSRHKLIMQPETLICSGQDAQFYLDQGLLGVSLSHELTEKEILQAAADATHPEGLEVLAAGYYTWMESRRPLIENYLRYIRHSDQFEEGKIYTIREMMRPARLPIWQDEKGVHILADTPRQISLAARPLAKAGIGRFRIDAFGLSNEWGADMVRAYRQLLNIEDSKRSESEASLDQNDPDGQYQQVLKQTGPGNLPLEERLLIKEKHHGKN